MVSRRVVDRGFYHALGSPEISGPDYCPFQSALANLSALRASGSTAAPVALSACSACRDGRYIDLHVTPLDGPAEPLLLVLARDVSRSVEQQQKLERCTRPAANSPCHAGTARRDERRRSGSSC